MATFDIFLSHNSRDKPAVERLAEKLKRERLDPWIDKWCLTPGTRWQDELVRGLRASATCAFFIGANGAGDWASEELNVALDRAARDHAFRVFLVLLPGVPEPFDATSLPPFLSTRTWVDLRKGIEDARGFRLLLSAIKGVAPGSERPIEARDDFCPYRGLQTFNEEHAAFFFGRNGDVQRLLEKLKATRFLAVIGSSGSGKSSVVRAGLIPRIKAGALPGSDAWKVQILTPGAHPITALAANLLRAFPHGAMAKTVDDMTRDPRALHLAVSLALAERPPGELMVWVFDQFEEVFTLCGDEQERKQFLDNVLYAASIPAGRTMVVLTMRADFYPKCAAFPDLSTRIAAQQFLISPMDLDGLRQAVEEPAWRVGLEFEEGLVATVLDDIASQPGALPLLEHALLELWERRRGRMMTLEAYRESGGVQGAIAKRADTIYERFSPEQQEMVRRIVLRLTQPGESTEDTRRRATMAELGESEAVEGVVRAMADARLLSVGADQQSGHRLVDVSHEALIRGWPRLRKWIDEDRASLRLLRRVTEAAQEWQRSNRDEGVLYRGAPLAQAVDWRERHEGELNWLEREFLDASAALKQRLEQEEWERQQRDLETAQELAEEQRQRAELSEQREKEQKEAAEKLRRAARKLRRRAIAATGAAAAAVILLAIAVTMWRAAQKQTRVAQEQRVKAEQQTRVAEEQKQEALDAKDKLEEKLQEAARSDRLVAQEEFARGEGASALAYLARAIGYEPTSSLPLQAALAAVLSPPIRHSIMVLTSHKDNGRGTPQGAPISNGAVSSVTFSPDGRRVLTGSADGTARLWGADGGKPLVTFQGHNDAVWSVAFSPDGRRVLTGSADGTARLWEADGGKPLVTFQGHNGAVWSVAFSPDGRRVLTGSGDRTARLWEADGGKLLGTFQSHNGPVRSVVFSPDGRRVLTGSEDNTARLWEVDGCRLLTTFSGHKNKVITGVAFSPDGRQVLTGSDDGTARLWEADTGKPLVTFQGHASWILSVAFSPDGRRVLTGSDDKTARLWETDSGRLLAAFQGHNGAVRSVAFSPDGRRVLTGSDDRTARLWEADGGRLLAAFQGHTDWIYSVTFSPDGRRVLTGSGDRTARLWEADSGKLLAAFQGHNGAVCSAAFSPDGRRVLTGSADNTARLWETDGGRLLTAFKGHTRGVRSVAFSPDGRQVLTGSDDGTARLWEADGGKPLSAFRGPNGFMVWSVAFSPDGRRVLTGSSDDTARLWEADGGRLLAIFQGHTKVVSGETFSPDGQRVLTGSGDKTARLWEADSGKLLSAFRGHNDGVRSVAFSPDGRRVLTGSEDHTARLWVVLPSNMKPPVWSGEFLIWLGGKRIDREGQIETLSGSDLQEIEDRLRPHQIEDTDFARLLRWHLLPPEEQPVDPYGTTTRKQAADLMIRPDMNEPEALHAYELDPWHPLVHLALAGFEKDSVRADFFRQYSLTRLSDDPKLRERAAAFLRQQGKEDLAQEVTGRGK